MINKKLLNLDDYVKGIKFSYGKTQLTTTPASGYIDVEIDYTSANFTEKPFIVATLEGNSTGKNNALSLVSIYRNSITNKKASIRYYNADTYSSSMYINWIAIGK